MMGEKDVKTTKNTAEITTNAQISTSRVLQGFSFAFTQKGAHSRDDDG